MDTNTKNHPKSITTVDIVKSNDGNTETELMSMLLSTKMLISTNRDGITVGTNIYCDINGRSYSATVCKNGYVLNGIEYLNLTDMTNALFDRKVHTNHLTIWYMDDELRYRH